MSKLNLPLVSDFTLYGTARKRNENIYNDTDKAKALIGCALMGLRKTEKFMCIPEQTLSDWWNGRHISSEVKRMAKYYAKDIEKALEEILQASLPQAVLKAKDGRTSFKDLMIGNGIAIEKLQLLKGLPTEIVDQAVNISAEERAKRLQSLLDIAETRADEDEAS